MCLLTLTTFDCFYLLKKISIRTADTFPLFKIFIFTLKISKSQFYLLLKWIQEKRTLINVVGVGKWKFVTEIEYYLLLWKPQLDRFFFFLFFFLLPNLSILKTILLFFLFWLQNIFLGEDIRKQLPKESEEFDEVNSMWKIIMTRLNKDKNALRGTHHPGTPTILGITKF